MKKYIKLVVIAFFLLSALPAHANLITPIDATATGWNKGGFGENVRTHTITACDFYTDTYMVWHPQCPPATRTILTTRFDGTDGDVKWYPNEVPIGANKNFVVSYEYQPYTTAAQVIAQYNFGDHYEYAVIADMLQYLGGMGYAYWNTATNHFQVPQGAQSFTLFFAHNKCPSNCPGYEVGALSIANVDLEYATTSSNLFTNPSFEERSISSQPLNYTSTPNAWFKGGWGDNTRNYYYITIEATPAMAVGVEITRYGSGAASWVPQYVPVTEGTYTFSDEYGSQVPTELGVQFKTATGTYYQFLKVVPPSDHSVNYVPLTQQIVVPKGVTALTVLHSIHNVGRLDLDSYSLTRNQTRQKHSKNR